MHAKIVLRELNEQEAQEATSKYICGNIDWICHIFSLNLIFRSIKKYLFFFSKFN